MLSLKLVVNLVGIYIFYFTFMVFDCIENFSYVGRDRFMNENAK